MEHHTFFKVVRVVLTCLSLIQVCQQVLAMEMKGIEDSSSSNSGTEMTIKVVKSPTSSFSLGKDKDKKDEGSGEDDKEDDDGDKFDGKCLDVKPSAWTLSNMYRDQPLYMNFRPRSEEAMLIDNICFTFFPLPDDQFTYTLYTSTVYRDGSNLVESDIITDVQLGIFRAASPYCSYREHVLGYAGCDTFVMYRCFTSSECRNKNSLYTFGLSQSCKQISISCLQKIEDIIQGNGIPEQEYVALPMKLPTQCVFEPMCTFKGRSVNEVGFQMGYNYNHQISEPFIEDIVVEPAVEYIETPAYIETPVYFPPSPPSPYYTYPQYLYPYYFGKNPY